jgi:plastocyanin
VSRWLILCIDPIPYKLVKESSFVAMLLTIKAGAVVTLTNTDDRPRTVRSDCGPTASLIGMDESITFTFDKPGTYHCLCSIHPRMIVTVVVE